MVGRWQKADRLLAPVSEADIDRLAAQLQKEFAPILSAGAGQEDVNRLIQQIAEKLAAEKKVELNPDLLTAKHGSLYEAYLTVSSALGAEHPTLFTEMWNFLEKRRDQHWREQVRQFDHEIFGRAVAAYDRYAIEELHKLADARRPLGGAIRPLSLRERARVRAVCVQVMLAETAQRAQPSP